MIDYQAVDISGFDFEATGFKDIHQNLRMLYTTPEESIPFMRDFGINIDFLDQPDQVARGLIMVEYRKKTKRYEPRVTVEDVQFEKNFEQGVLTPKVVVSIDSES